MSKVDQKRNWVKFKSVQTLLRIACLANRKSYVVIMCQFMWKVDQKLNWVKLKSVQALLRIACLADRKSYVVIMCQFMWKVDQKWKCIKLKSVQILLKIAGLAHRKSYMWSLYVPILSKVYQKRNFVKSKSVRTLLKIACVADRKSYVVIIYASSCEKFTKIEIFIQILLKIVPNLTFKGHPRSKVIQFKDHEVNWKTIYMYMTSYICVSCKICTIQKIQPITNSIIFDLTSKGHPRSKVMR